MNGMFLGVLTLSLVVMSGCQSPGRQQVRVLAYNIHHAEGTDGELDLARIAQVIESVQPDLVALQEVDNRTQRTGGVDQTAELGQLTGMQAVFGKAMDYQGGGYGLAILSRWNILESVTHPLPSTEGHEPRAVLMVKVRTPRRSELWFGSTHFDHTREETERLGQAARIREMFASRNEPVILAGDFNAVPESRVMKLLLEDWLDASALEPQPTVPANKPRSRIDYVLVRPKNGWKTIETRVLEEAVASDHRPLFVVVEWPGR
jgi:endonuclease/exonuclease/phosphatase family metal-dependent hydrolase